MYLFVHLFLKSIKMCIFLMMYLFPPMWSVVLSHEYSAKVESITISFTQTFIKNRITFRIAPRFDSINKIDCSNCLSSDYEKVYCEEGKLVQIKIQIQELNIPFNISCTRDLNLNRVGNIEVTFYKENTTKISWTVSDPSINRYVIFVMDKEEHFYEVIKTKETSYVMHGLINGRRYTICLATIDRSRSTGRYTCSKKIYHNFYVTGPVEGVSYRTSMRSILLSWNKPSRKYDTPQGYQVNVGHLDFTCGGIFVNMTKQTGVSECHNLHLLNISRQSISIVINDLQFNTHYDFAICPVSEHRSATCTTVNISTKEGPSGPVSDLKMKSYIHGLNISFSAPRIPNGLISKYKIQIWYYEGHVCNTIGSPLFEEYVNETLKQIVVTPSQKCGRFQGKVSPVNGCAENDGLGLSDSVSYEYGGDFTNINATFLSQKLLRLSWSNERLFCGNGIYVIEVKVENMILSYLITNYICQRVYQEISKLVNARFKEYMHYNERLPRIMLDLQGAFKNDMTYAVTIKRITSDLKIIQSNPIFIISYSTRRQNRSNLFNERGVISMALRSPIALAVMSRDKDYEFKLTICAYFAVALTGLITILLVVCVVVRRATCPPMLRNIKCRSCFNPLFGFRRESDSIVNRESLLGNQRIVSDVLAGRVSLLLQEDFRTNKNCYDLSNFLKVYADFTDDILAKLNVEYQDLVMDACNQELELGLTIECGKLSGNSKKNRFANILPFDQTRVHLVGKRPPYDYINASFVSFLEEPLKPEYIATQGPLKESVADFWAMVWHQGVTCIVMLTTLCVDKKSKCFKYWPDCVGDKDLFGDRANIEVTLLSEVAKNGFCERVLVVLNKKSRSSRSVTQLHIDTWMDYSAPSLSAFENIFDRFRDISNENGAPPYLIHCSSGVGRTGTFICIDRIIKMIMVGVEYVNIYDTVLDLMSFRCDMVQCSAHYSFIFEFIRYFLIKNYDQ